MLRRALALVVLLVVSLAPIAHAGAQDPVSTTTTYVGVPSPNIVPLPNSGTPPTEAGDRGGALQLGLLALLVVVLGAGVLRLVGQSRRARETGAGGRRGRSVP